jgi:hypothetical protein
LSLTLREEDRLRVFENRVLRKIFGPKKNEVRWKRRRLHNEELYDLHSSPNIIRVIKPFLCKHTYALSYKFYCLMMVCETATWRIR